MALTVCAHCGNKSFELKGAPVMGSNYGLYFVQCASCGAPVGVVGFFDAGILAKEATAGIEKLGQRLLGIESTLEQIQYSIRNR